jgi:hypothetical protein
MRRTRGAAGVVAAIVTLSAGAAVASDRDGSQQVAITITAAAAEARTLTIAGDAPAFAAQAGLLELDRTFTITYSNPASIGFGANILVDVTEVVDQDSDEPADLPNGVVITVRAAQPPEGAGFPNVTGPAPNWGGFPGSGSGANALVVGKEAQGLIEVISQGGSADDLEVTASLGGFAMSTGSVKLTLRYIIESFEDEPEAED